MIYFIVLYFIVYCYYLFALSKSDEYFCPPSVSHRQFNSIKNLLFKHYRSALEILVLITFAEMYLIDAHADISSEAIDLKFGLSLRGGSRIFGKGVHMY